MLIVRTRAQNNDNGTSVASTTIRFRGSRSTRPPIAVGVEIDLERVVHTDAGSVHRFGETADGYNSRDDRISINSNTKELEVAAAV